MTDEDKAQVLICIQYEECTDGCPYSNLDSKCIPNRFSHPVFTRVSKVGHKDAIRIALEEGVTTEEVFEALI